MEEEYDTEDVVMMISPAPLSSFERTTPLSSPAVDPGNGICNEDLENEQGSSLSATESWQPIYLSMLLFVVQCFLFLFIFEYGRRHPAVASVYDRKRTKHPSRTPPPLRQLRRLSCCGGATGCIRRRKTKQMGQRDSASTRTASPSGNISKNHALARTHEDHDDDLCEARYSNPSSSSWSLLCASINGLFAFEWWKLNVGDEVYQMESIKEHSYILRHRHRRLSPTTTHLDAENGGGEDKHLQRALGICYRDSPMYDPVDEDIDDLCSSDSSNSSPIDIEHDDEIDHYNHRHQLSHKMQLLAENEITTHHTSTTTGMPITEEQDLMKATTKTDIEVGSNVAGRGNLRFEGIDSSSFINATVSSLSPQAPSFAVHDGSVRGGSEGPTAVMGDNPFLRSSLSDCRDGNCALGNNADVGLHHASTKSVTTTGRDGSVWQAQDNHDQNDNGGGALAGQHAEQGGSSVEGYTTTVRTSAANTTLENTTKANVSSTTTETSTSSWSSSSSVNTAVEGVGICDGRAPTSSPAITAPVVADDQASRDSIGLAAATALTGASALDVVIDALTSPSQSSCDEGETQQEEQEDLEHEELDGAVVSDVPMDVEGDANRTDCTGRKCIGIPNSLTEGAPEDASLGRPAPETTFMIEKEKEAEHSIDAGRRCDPPQPVSLSSLNSAGTSLVSASSPPTNGDSSLDEEFSRKVFQGIPKLCSMERPQQLRRSRSDEFSGAGTLLRNNADVRVAGRVGSRKYRGAADTPSQSRHLRNRSRQGNLSRRDVRWGSEEAGRLAKLRYRQPEAAAWDTRTLSRIASFIRTRVLMLHRDDISSINNNANNLAAGCDASPGGRKRDLVAVKVMRRPLTTEQEQLLRCVGLDAFMTLRFLRFGFDVSFWPFLLSLITLVPFYASSGASAGKGFFSITIMALCDHSPRFFVVMFFGVLHFGYILRRIWIEWELFLPLRYDFLDNGDFADEKYKEQFRKTCLVEYLPAAYSHDKALYGFFDAVFPGQVRRAEVLLDTEYLSSLLSERSKHIVGYEDGFAKKVHLWANYLRDLESFQTSGPIRRCCRSAILKPREPKNPQIIVVHRVPRDDTGNAFLNPFSKTVSDPRTYDSLKWHHWRIGALNKKIEDEFLRLAREQRRKPRVTYESPLAKWLGLKYLIGSDSGRVRSATAFVEFRTLAAKQQAIQCNITGKNNYMVVSPVPVNRDILWENAHVPRALIETRKTWVNIGMIGFLLGWSYCVSHIRNFDRTSVLLNLKEPMVAGFVDFYLPAVIVEGIVRLIPLAARKFVCPRIRFKAASEVDHYVLWWYFACRLFTFVFVIIGNTLIESGDDLISDPIRFVKRLAMNVPMNAPFFIAYVAVAGGIQIFFRLSQLHNLMIHWFTHKIITDEATSQRRLEALRTDMKIFHLDEFIPLFIFIFMVGALYGSLSPLSGLVVAIFFLCAYKVFRYMTLYIYGNNYEGGGFLFYALSDILFYVLYMIILVIAGYLSLHHSAALAGLFCLLLFVTAIVHWDVHQTFVVPSRTLSLTMARMSDECKDKRSDRERKIDAFFKAKRDLESMTSIDEDDEDRRSKRDMLMDPMFFTEYDDYDDEEDGADGTQESVLDSERLRRIFKRMDRRYREKRDSSSGAGPGSEAGDSSFGLTDSLDGHSGPGGGRDFFIYRQPSLNRATWEVTPRAYRSRRDSHTDM